MRTKVTFQVRKTLQSPVINKLMQQADLVESVHSTKRDDEKAHIIWKEGEIVDVIRIEKAMQGLRQAYQQAGYTVESIEFISQEQVK